MARVVSANSRARSEMVYVTRAGASGRRAVGIGSPRVDVRRHGPGAVHDTIGCAMRPARDRAVIMPSELQFPHPSPPAPGESLEVAHGVLWVRMPLPFALDHINLWLLRDGEGYALV